MTTIAILGAGVMASALTVPLADNGHDVRLVGTHLDRDIIDTVRATGVHPGLQRKLPSSVRPYQLEQADAAFDRAEIVVSGVNSLGVAWAGQRLAELQATHPQLGHSQQGEVAPGVEEDHGGTQLAPGPGDHLMVGGAGDHVGVGHHQVARRHRETAAEQQAATALALDLDGGREGAVESGEETWTHSLASLPGWTPDPVFPRTAAGGAGARDAPGCPHGGGPALRGARPRRKADEPRGAGTAATSWPAASRACSGAI